MDKFLDYTIEKSSLLDMSDRQLSRLLMYTDRDSVRRHIVGGANRRLISVIIPPPDCTVWHVTARYDR